jgi:molybdate transport system ATP-binding protein
MLASSVTRRISIKRLLPQKVLLRGGCFSSVVDDIDEETQATTDRRKLSSVQLSSPPLLEFSNARLSYGNNLSSSTALSSLSSSSYYTTPSISWSIYPPNLTHDDPSQRQGGYAMLGRNASAKSLVGLSLMATTQNFNLQETSSPLSSSTTKNKNLYIQKGCLTVHAFQRWHSRAVAYVSFHSHQELLSERDDKTGDYLTAFKAIATAGGAPGKLNAAAQFLVVRFGLYPLLHRTVETLSTGEIRKVLLIRALSQRPKLLVLDNAFDGLDVPSRDILKDLVSRTLRGFRQDILVQGVSSKATARTQIVLMTHRAEEIVNEIDTVVWFDNAYDNKNENSTSQFQMIKRHFHDGLEPISSKDVLHRALGMEAFSEQQRLAVLEWNDPTLPSVTEVQNWWWNHCEPSDKNITCHGSSLSNRDIVVVQATDLSIQRGDVTLLHNLDWTVRRGERWIVGGGNGAGKSTLSRLLAKPENVNYSSSLQILPNADPNHPRSSAVGWVSTETHLNRHQGPHNSSLMTARELLETETNGASWEDVIAPVLSWLEIADTSVKLDAFLHQPFDQLSQGQQKLILLAAAIAKRPPLLVLDEPCQGLDLLARRRLLQVVERICSVTDMSLIYITHHLEEERIPSISLVLHLKDRKAVYQGPIEDYNPADYYMVPNK